MSRALEGTPVTRRGLDEGRVSIGGARVLARAFEQHPEAFARDEAVLVDAAERHGVGDLTKAVSFWRARVSATETAQDQRWESRSLHASRTLDGMVRVDADLDPETGEHLLTAIHSVLDSAVRGGELDDRTPAQARADALGEICAGWLRNGDRHEVAGERPHINVTVDLPALVAAKPGGLEHTGAVAPSVIRRIACDASVTRIVFGPESEPLDVGRRSPVVPAPMRRALVARDRGCRFPHCDRPPSWTDAHHIRHWADGGPTAISNLALLCRRHHRAVHEERFRIEGSDAGPLFHRQDGTVLRGADRAPP